MGLKLYFHFFYFFLFAAASRNTPSEFNDSGEELKPVSSFKQSAQNIEKKNQ